MPQKTSAAGGKNFQPLEMMGYFWSIFGLIVLGATFFVQETSMVPHLRGVVTNIAAGSVLLIAGVFSIIRGRRKS